MQQDATASETYDAFVKALLIGAIRFRPEKKISLLQQLRTVETDHS